MIFESLGILLLLVPVFLPSPQAFDVDVIWFGITIILAVELELITPPIGMNVFPSNRLSRMFAGVMPFIFAMIVALALLIPFPDIATRLPNLMR